MPSTPAEHAPVPLVVREVTTVEPDAIRRSGTVPVDVRAPTTAEAAHHPAMASSARTGGARASARVAGTRAA